MIGSGHTGGLWVRGPVGRRAASIVTRAGCRTVLLMVPTMAAGARLLDLVPLLEADCRVQVVVTVPHEGQAWHGLEEFVRTSGILAMPWQQAVHHDWDLVLTASHRHIDQVHGKVLVLPHGAGAARSRTLSRKGGAVRPTTGLDRDLLTYRGRLIPSVLAISHHAELDILRRTCPEAEAVAVIAGDICLDRMMQSLRFRDQYRAALGLEDGQQFVTVSSTWSTDSTFGTHTGLYTRLLDEIAQREAVGPSGDRVAAVIHPAVWAAHGRWQVRSWLAPARRAGLLLVPPDEGWRAVMIASDVVVGDHGSTTAYAAAIGRPVCLAAVPHDVLRPNSIAATLAGRVPRLDHSQPLLPQLRDAVHCAAEVSSAISSRMGYAADVLRTAMYRLLELDLPPWPPRTAPVPLPRPSEWW